MDIFLNLCTFLNELLPQYYDTIDQRRIGRWLPTLLERVVNVAVRPECHNVSGFYKLLTLAIRAGIQSNAFSPGTSNTIQCRNILRPFLVGIHQRVHNYTDELLASCVDFVLSLPNPTLIQIDRQIPFLIRALKLGLSHVPTAKSALRTLEQWTLKPSFVVHLQHVLPHLSGYLLQSRSGGGAQTAEEDDDGNENDGSNGVAVGSQASVVGRAARAKRRRERQKRKTAKDGARSAGWTAVSNDEEGSAGGGGVQWPGGSSMGGESHGRGPPNVSHELQQQ